MKSDIDPFCIWMKSDIHPFCVWMKSDTLPHAEQVMDVKDVC
jgi:hypothetical protein